MYVNLPIGSYYPKNNQKFLDPLYVPYQDKSFPIFKDGGTDGKGKVCKTPLNTWPKNSCSPDIYPDTLRIGWNMDFQRVHPQDKCPAGWKDSGENDGVCKRMWQGGHESNFYTDKTFQVEYQYFDGYAVQPTNKKSNGYLKSLDPHPTLEQRSVNPYTGEYVTYFEPPPNKSSLKYSKVPSRHSYLGMP
jgi:hypothetical protein